MVFNTEEELERATIPFLEDKGLTYKWRVPLYNRVVDLGAIDSDGNIIGIEYKLKNWKRAIEQALINSNSFDYIYVCVPNGRYVPRLISEAEKHGIGVLCFDYDEKVLKEGLTAKKNDKQWYPNKLLVKNFLINGG